jgi:hypothetical protein
MGSEPDGVRAVIDGATGRAVYYGSDPNSGYGSDPIRL